MSDYEFVVCRRKTRVIELKRVFNSRENVISSLRHLRDFFKDKGRLKHPFFSVRKRLLAIFPCVFCPQRSTSHGRVIFPSIIVPPVVFYRTIPPERLDAYPIPKASIEQSSSSRLLRTLFRLFFFRTRLPKNHIFSISNGFFSFMYLFRFVHK